MGTADGKSTQRKDISTFVVAALFCVIVLGIVVFMNIKNTMDLQEVLRASVESQLISTSVAAREIIDVDKFVSYNSEEDALADARAYQDTLQQLRLLATNVGAEYIYALKEIDGAYYFVFDTDPVDEEIFIPYELSPVHEAAFAGKEAADIMNVEDAYGSFNTGAVPLWKEGKVVGIVSTDIEDTYLMESYRVARLNATVLVLILVATMGAMLVVIYRLTTRVSDMQGKLEKMAHYDMLTGLPNRQYLMEQLLQMTQNANRAPFALFFIDLDNFKRVNDQAGHDAGDELLRHVGAFFKKVDGEGEAFRPQSGQLNIAARMGGDEFVLLSPNANTEEKARELAEKLLRCFQTEKFDRFIDKYDVGLSIGVALYPYHTDSYHVLIKYADIAMYQAKRDGKNNYRIYSDEMGQNLL